MHILEITVLQEIIFSSCLPKKKKKAVIFEFNLRWNFSLFPDLFLMEFNCKVFGLKQWIFRTVNSFCSAGSSRVFPSDCYQWVFFSYTAHKQKELYCAKSNALIQYPASDGG